VKSPLNGQNLLSPSEKFELLKISSFSNNWSDPLQRKADLDQLGMNDIYDVRRNRDSGTLKVKVDKLGPVLSLIKIVIWIAASNRENVSLRVSCTELRKIVIWKP
jgi:hypothetical protein